MLSTGQSLAVGFRGTPALTTEQPFHNWSFASGVIGDAYGLGDLIPLVEGDVVGGEHGTVMHVETMSSAFANLVSAEAERFARDSDARTHDLLVSVHGRSGTRYAGLKKGTKAYRLGLQQVTAAKKIADRRGESYVVRAVTIVHGEADHTEHNPRYEADVLAWQADYDRDVRAVTGQDEPVVMFETQMSGFTALGSATSAIPLAQLRAHVDAPGRVILVGPKYHLPYSDGLHLTNEGYRHMGEDYAKSYRRVILEGQAWEPVRPRDVARDGDTIHVRFYVPSPPLVLDTDLVTNPGHFGFEYTDESGSSPSIAEVAIESEDTVRIRLTAIPTAEGGHLRYAMSGRPNARSGRKSGARGNLRDSDATVSRYGYPLYNWCVHFDESVP